MKITVIRKVYIIVPSNAKQKSIFRGFTTLGGFILISRSIFVVHGFYLSSIKIVEGQSPRVYLDYDIARLQYAVGYLDFEYPSISRP